MGLEAAAAVVYLIFIRVAVPGLWCMEARGEHQGFSVGIEKKTNEYATGKKKINFMLCRYFFTPS